MNHQDKSHTALNASTAKEDRQFQLNKQLHEQFAVNDNNKISSFISFLAAIFSVFVGYGFAYHHSCFNPGHYCLVAATIASLLILGLVCILCLFFGYSTRRDQFITHDIREKYGVKLRYTNPLERKANILNFLPDYYSIMLYACIIFMILLTAATVMQLSQNETSICLVIAASVILLIVIGFMWFYYGKYKNFKEKYGGTKKLKVMKKSNFLKWCYRILILVVGIFIVVILINILLFSCSHLEFYLYINGDSSGIVDNNNLHDYLNVLGTLILALMAAFAFRESLKMRERSSFNSIFTQLLSNHVAIFKDVAESNPISSSTKIKTNVFANFYDYYIRIRTRPMDADGLKDLWKKYCDKEIPDGIKFSHAFKYVFHEVKTVYDEYPDDDPMREHYIKIIQANMSQDELFCYLINLLQHYLNSEGDEKKETKEYLEKLKKSKFFEDLTRVGGKYRPVICELQNIHKLEIPFPLEPLAKCDKPCNDGKSETGSCGRSGDSNVNNCRYT